MLNGETQMVDDVVVNDVDTSTDDLDIDVLEDVIDSDVTITDDSQVEPEETVTPSFNGKKVGLSAIEKMMDSVSDDANLTDVQKAEIRKSIDVLKDAGVVTNGRGGGKTDTAYTEEMTQFRADYDALVEKATSGSGLFVDLNGDNRKPQFYMPTKTAKNAVK
jgi:predicted transcriptional regulator